MDAATIHGATAGSAAPGPEGQRKLAGGGAKRNHRDQMNVATIHVAAAGGAAPGPEGPRKLAGGGAKRNHRDQNRVTITPRRGGGTGVPGVSPDAPAGARSSFCLGSGGSRSRRSLHHRLISNSPSGRGIRSAHLAYQTTPISTSPHA